MENDLSGLVDALPGLAWTARPDGTTDFFSRRWSEYTGSARARFDGQDWLMALHPDDQPRLIGFWQSMFEAASPNDLEARLRRADGAYRWFLFRAAPLTGRLGEIVQWCGFGIDIDDRRRSERAQHPSGPEDERARSDELLAGEKQVLEMVAVGSSLPLVLDALCRLGERMAEGCYCGILFFNAGGQTWQHGAGPSLPAGYNQTMHGRPAHRASGPCGLAASLKTQVVVSDIMTDTQWDLHGWRTLALTHGLRSCWSAPILSQDKEALGALAFYRRESGSPTTFQRNLIDQLTHIASIAVERSRAEIALKRSEAFLAEAQRISATGSFSWRVGTDDIDWSEQAHRILGFDMGVRVTLDLVASRVHPDDMPEVSKSIERARQGGGDFEYEHRLLMPDQTVKHVHLLARGSSDQDGRLEYIGAVRDVTQSRLSAQALDKVRTELARVARIASLGALTASITHEINQPLSGIVTNASTCLRMLAADPPNVDGARETAQRTIRDGRRASDVITRLRALFGNKSATIEHVDLNEAAQEVIALSMSELHRNRVIPTQRFADDLPSVAGDRVQLQQVILNLLLNASEAMNAVHDRPRHLMITTGRDADNGIRLTVQDAGMGLDPATADHLFEAFFTTRPDGMGIGLSVSRSIIESHRGRLWAEPNDGPGASFSFSLPHSLEAADAVNAKGKQ